MSEEEFWLTVKRTEEFFLPFDVVYIVSRRGAGRGQGEALLPSPLFHSPKQFGIFYFSHHSYQYECTHISTLTKTTDMHTPCQSHNLPVQSNNYKVFQRNTWITKKLVYHPIIPLASGCEFTRQHCHSFWYFIIGIHFSLFQMWSVPVVCLHCSFYWKRSTVLLTGISGSAIDFLTGFLASLFPLKNSSLSVLVT